MVTFLQFLLLLLLWSCILAIGWFLYTYGLAYCVFCGYYGVM